MPAHSKGRNNARNRSDTSRAAIRRRSQMTERNNARKDKKTAGRMTPRDVRVRGTFAEPARREGKAFRGPAAAERRADNTAMKAFAEAAASARGWERMFREELGDINRGKVGRPYSFCDSEIFWVMSLQTLLGMSFRMAAGLAAAILGGLGLASPSASRLCERGAELADSLVSAGGGEVLAVRACACVSDRVRNAGIDSTGFNLSDTTLWRTRRWGTRTGDRGWLKLHALSDTDTGEILAYAVTTERAGDSPLLVPLLDAALGAGHRIGRVYADGAYSSVGNFRHVCEDLGMEFVTSFRSDTVPKNNGSPARGRAARLWCALTYREWVEATGYGRRWKCECVFSDLKRILDETLDAHTPEGAVRRLVMKVEVFNRYKAARWGILTGAGAPA